MNLSILKYNYIVFNKGMETFFNLIFSIRFCLLFAYDNIRLNSFADQFEYTSSRKQLFYNVGSLSTKYQFENIDKAQSLFGFKLKIFITKDILKTLSGLIYYNPFKNT